MFANEVTIMFDMWKKPNAGLECECVCMCVLQVRGERELLGKKGGGGRRKKGWRQFSPEDEEEDDLEHGRLARGGPISKKNGEEERRFIRTEMCEDEARGDEQFCTGKPNVKD